ncbi:MAG TPA: hypothetical protein VN081_01220 [Dongiaceae bacterium]|nr:hypothetical protein [Dongiaceae bacterium]
MSDSDNNNAQGGFSGNFDPSTLGPLDDLKLRMYAEPVNGARKRPQLRVQIYENNPRFVIKTNMDNDKDHGKIQAAMDLPIFFMVADNLRTVINGPNEQQLRIVNKKRKFINGESKILDDTYTVIGKDAQGVVWISILAYDKERPRIKFEFMPNEYHTITNRDGSPYDKGKISQSYANGWLNTLEGVLKSVFVKDYKYVDYYAKKSDRKQAAGGNNQGGNQNRSYSNQGGGGGNYNRNQSNQQSYQSRGSTSVDSDWSADDDLPM